MEFKKATLVSREGEAWHIYLKPDGSIYFKDQDTLYGGYFHAYDNLDDAARDGWSKCDEKEDQRI